MNGTEFRDIRLSLRLSQADLVRALNRRLGRSYDAPKLSRWETSSKPIPEDVAQVINHLKAEAPMEARVLVLANQKGGVGKTTTALNLAFGLSRGGKNVLLVDMDPQATASYGVLADAAVLAFKAGRTIAHVLLDDAPILDAIIRKGESLGKAPPPPFDIVPSHINLAETDSKREPGMDAKLSEALDPIRGMYDFIVIDAPPHLGMLTSLALTAGHDVIIPVRTEPYDSMGIGLIVSTIRKVQRRTNPSLRLRGILPTQFNRRKAVDQTVLAQLSKSLGDQVPILAPVPDNAVFGRAAYAGTIALQNFPASAAVLVYGEIADCLVLGHPLPVYTVPNDAEPTHATVAAVN
jgi:chromosome partitioning protein